MVSNKVLPNSVFFKVLKNWTSELKVATVDKAINPIKNNPNYYLIVKFFWILKLRSFNIFIFIIKVYKIFLYILLFFNRF